MKLRVSIQKQLTCIVIITYLVQRDFVRENFNNEVQVVSTSDCHPRGPGFDSRLYPRNFSGSKGSVTRSTQPREDNWVATCYEKQRNPVNKTEIKVEG